MKVLFYINVLSGGGAERVIANLANKFSDKDEVILVNSFPTPKEYMISDNIKHIYLDDNSFSSRIKKNISRILKLRKIIKSERPDVAIAFMAEPNIRILISSIGLNVKTIISVRNDPEREYPGITGKMVTRFLFPLADGLVFQTSEAKAYFSKRIQQKSIVIYNPVANDFYYEDAKNEKNNIVMVGRLTAQKNYFLMIDAMASLRTVIDDQLFIYGDGELKEEINDYITKKELSNVIHLMGNTTKIADELKKYRLFVMTSDYEGLPNSLMEAMASGLVCISTDCPCGGPRELLNSQALIPVSNRKALENKIVEIFNDGNLYNEMKTFNLRKANEFRIDNIFEQWRSYISR